MRRHLVSAAVLAALLTSARAGAAEPVLGGPRDTWPAEITRRPLTLGAGMVEIWAPLQLNASKDADWKPVSSNPSIAFGVTDHWTIGVRHIFGLCAGNESDGCPDRYNDVGAFTRISLLRGAGLDAAVQGAVHVSPLSGSDHNWSADASVLLRAGGGALAITVQPTVGFGLNNRNQTVARLTPIAWNLGTYDVITADVVTPGSAIGNKENVSLPVTLQLQLGPVLALAVGASLEGPLNPEVGSFSDYYHVPVGAAAVFTPVRYLDVGASFTFPRFAGKEDTRDLRQLALFVAFRI
jgi:hypothetical protein